MQQARYATVNAGHFGLASESYTHFTSPIRRYPDLLVHRLLRKYAAHPVVKAEEKAADTLFLANAADYASVRERVAVEAERDTADLKKAQYMKPFIGESYESHITGITGFGLFVSLDDGIEGLVHISYLRDDEYIFDEGTYTLVGCRSGRRYRLGDAMTVTLASVDTERCEIDFVPGRIDSLEDLQTLLAGRKAKKSGKKTEKKSGKKDRKKGQKKEKIPSSQSQKSRKKGSKLSSVKGNSRKNGKGKGKGKKKHRR